MENNWLKELKSSPEYTQERFIAEIQSELQRLMNKEGKSKAELAGLMGVSKARVSQLFSDEHNFTVRLLARAFHALGAKPTIRGAPLEDAYQDCPPAHVEQVAQAQTRRQWSGAVASDRVLMRALEDFQRECEHTSRSRDRAEVQMDLAWRSGRSRANPWKAAANKAREVA